MTISSHIINERRSYIMSPKKKTKFYKRLFKNQIFISVISELVFAILIFLVGQISGFLSLPSRVTQLEENVENLTLNSTPSETIQTAPVINNYYGYESYEPIEAGILKVSSGSVEPPYLLAPPSWEINDTIIENKKTKEKITAGELINKKIFLPYKDGNQEIYFYGQFDDNNQWDKDCIINVYQDNILISIMEAQYDSGTLLQYKQVSKSSTKNQTEIWMVCDKVRKKDENKEYNTGETWNYIYREYKKNFLCEDATIKDIKDVNEFEEYLKEISWLEGYYYGNTSDGFYNDDTGNSYMIKYFEDGTVRTLYYGNFANGVFDDDTGDAWYITRGKNTHYMYYKGFYEKGETSNNPGHIFEDPPLSIERIYEILEDNHCNLTLKWSDSDIKE